VEALEGWVWEGVSTPHGERVWGEGYAPSSENFRIFGVRMTCFGAFLALFLVTE